MDFKKIYEFLVGHPSAYVFALIVIAVWLLFDLVLDRPLNREQLIGTVVIASLLAIGVEILHRKSSTKK